MLTPSVLEQLTTLGLTGFRAALEAQHLNAQYAELTFEGSVPLTGPRHFCLFAG